MHVSLQVTFSIPPDLGWKARLFHVACRPCRRIPACPKQATDAGPGEATKFLTFAYFFLSDSWQWKRILHFSLTTYNMIPVIQDESLLSRRVEACWEPPVEAGRGAPDGPSEASRPHGSWTSFILLDHWGMDLTAQITFGPSISCTYLYENALVVDCLEAYGFTPPCPAWLTGFLGP